MTEQSGAPQDAPEDSPDPLADPAVDQARAAADDEVVGDEEDPYALRSMPAQPNPTEGDPGSFLNP